MTDFRSPLANELIMAGSYDKLAVTGAAPARAVKLLAGVRPEQLLTVPVVSYPHAAAMLSGLWLLHDALDESHQIAQKDAQDLHQSAPFPHQTPSETSQKVDSVEYMENRKRPNPQQLRDATASLAFWHGRLQ